MDPYQWRESVLSTRSLSYLSTIDALGGSPGLGVHSRNASTSFARIPTRRSTMTSADGSDYGDDLEMARGSNKDRELKDIPELPESVAESALFTLPREIRDRIYGFCLQAQGRSPVVWPPLPGASAHYALQPQLLRCCSIIYEETAPLLYSLNDMTFYHPSDANMFVRALSSPNHGRHISSLSLNLKALDTRLWMPYLISSDRARSLQADFPHVRELNIRFRSNKWNHNFSPERNLEVWSDDSRLDEIVDGLRHVFLPSKRAPSPGGLATKPLNEMTEQDFMAFVDRHRPGEDMAFKRQLLELHKANVPAATMQPPPPPSIKVICACRVHSTHFNFITNPDAPAQPILAGVGHQPPAIQPLVPPTKVQEGEAYRGFSIVDFRSATVKSHRDELGSTKEARTAFADKDGIWIALEVHSLEPKRSESHRHAAANAG